MIAAVTGARGLIGRYIVINLLASGWHVRVLTRQPEGMKEYSGVEVVVADINDKEAIKGFLKGVSSVFHCAAELHDESRMHDVNVLGTSCLLDVLSTLATVKYFCYLSSAGVVGPTSIAKVDEATECYPNNVYERTKYEAEKMVLQAGLKMNVCVLRPANVFDSNNLGISGLASRSSAKRILSLFIKGNEGAHLVHAKDVASTAMFFIDKKLLEPEIFFVSYDDDKRNTLQGVYKLCSTIQGKSYNNFCLSLPNYIPFIIRKLFKGKSLHGRVRFSEEKLQSSGFVFPLGLKGALMDICCLHQGGES